MIFVGSLRSVGSCCFSIVVAGICARAFASGGIASVCSSKILTFVSGIRMDLPVWVSTLKQPKSPVLASITTAVMREENC